MKYIYASTSLIMFAISMTLLAGIDVLMGNASGDRIGPKITPYQTMIEQSDLVIIAKTLDGNSIQIKDEEGPEPKPVVKTIGMSQSTVMPKPSSWKQDDLLNPPKIWTYRVKLLVLGVYKGNMQEQSVVFADIGYAKSESDIERYTKFEGNKTFCSKDSIAVYHLKRLTIEGNDDSVAYELLDKPWHISNNELEQTVKNMKIRFERYSAMQKISDYLKDFDALDEEKLNDFLALISSSKSTLGTPVYIQSQKKELDILIEKTKKGEASADEWRKCWDKMKNTYIVMPFRIIGDQQKLDTTSNDINRIRTELPAEKAKRSDIVLIGKMKDVKIEKVVMIEEIKNALSKQQEIVLAVFASTGKKPAVSLTPGKPYFFWRAKIEVIEKIKGDIKEGDELIVDYAVSDNAEALMKNGKIDYGNRAKFWDGERKDIICLIKPENGLNYRLVFGGTPDNATDADIETTIQEIRDSLNNSTEMSAMPSSVALEGFTLLHAKVKDADQVYAALVISDYMVMPGDAESDGAYRVLKTKPLISLKGALPEGIVTIQYFHAKANYDVMGKVIEWSKNYQFKFFQEGGIYFIALNIDASGKFHFRDTLESNVRIDDPSGKGREEIKEAFSKANLPLPADWQNKIDSEYKKIMWKYNPPFMEWVAGADLIAALKIESADVSKLGITINALKLPEDFNITPPLGEDKIDMNRFIAANWHEISATHITWTLEGIPLLAALMKEDNVSPYALKVSYLAETENIPLGETLFTLNENEIQLAFGLEKSALINIGLVTEALKRGDYIIVPLQKVKDQKLYRACGRPICVTPNDLPSAMRMYRFQATRLQQIKFLNSIFIGYSVKELPSKADWHAAELIVGKRFTRDKQGYKNFAEYWLMIRSGFADEPKLFEQYN